MQHEKHPVVEQEELVLRDYLATERTVLSNERTFLAYLRTALAFAAGGVSLITFLASLASDIAGSLLIVGAVATFAIGTWRFIQTKGPLDRVAARSRLKWSKGNTANRRSKSA